MIYNTAYDTTACNGFRNLKFVEPIQEAHARDHLQQVDGTLLIMSNRGASSAIPAFNHPIYIGKRDPEHLHAVANWTEGAYLATDLRGCGTWNEEKGRYDIRNSTLYKMKLYRAALTSVWLSQGPNSIRNLTPMATSVFASWISESMRSRYGLDPKTQYDVMILAAIFYTSNHMNGTEFDKANENRYLAGISNTLKVELKAVIALYDQSKIIHSVEDFCSKVRSITGNVRLEDLNAGMLTGIMAGTWFGDNSAETVLVALEHPPTWLSILLEAYTNTAMRKSTVAKICERSQYKSGLEMLGRAVVALAPETAALVAESK